MSLENIIVSVCCITYNHREFIEQALDSFLSQKTSFRYEILEIFSTVIKKYKIIKLAMYNKE